SSRRCRHLKWPKRTRPCRSMTGSRVRKRAWRASSTGGSRTTGSITRLLIEASLLGGGPPRARGGPGEVAEPPRPTKPGRKGGDASASAASGNDDARGGEIHGEQGKPPFPTGPSGRRGKRRRRGGKS